MNMSIHKKNLYNNENGQALVEFTLILPILILLVLGIIEFGWLLNAQITLNSSAREGARVGAVLNTSEEVRRTKMLEAVNATAQFSGLNILEDECLVEEENDYAANVHNISIVVYADVNSIIGLYVPDTITMTSSAKMRRE